MSKKVKSVLLVIGLVVLGFILYVVKLDYNLRASLNTDIERRFALAGAQVQILDESTTPSKVPTELESAIIGQAATTEFLMSFRVVSFYSKRGSLPASLEETDPSGPGQHSAMRDPWGNPFRLVPDNPDRFLIVSGGARGISSLAAEEVDALRNKAVGRVYQLHGKIIFNGGLLAGGPSSK